MRATFSSGELAHIGKPAGDRRSGGHGRTDQVRASTSALTPFEVAIRCGRTTLTRLEPVGVHGKTHGATRLTPLEARSDEDLVEAFRLGLAFDQTGARHHQGQLTLSAL
jgi:hypothetical protein